MLNGRPSRADPSILEKRPLTAADLAGLEREPVAGNKVKKLRGSHHRIALLLAAGYRDGEVADMVGYSTTRIAQLKHDPAFADLMAYYQNEVDENTREELDVYYSIAIQNRIKTARMIGDKLDAIEDAGLDTVSLRELVTVHSDFADRTGYPKRSVAVNVNVDFAAQLEKAVKRSAAAQAQRPMLTLVQSPSEGKSSHQPPSEPAREENTITGGEASRAAAIEPMRRRI